MLKKEQTKGIRKRTVIGSLLNRDRDNTKTEQSEVKADAEAEKKTEGKVEQPEAETENEAPAAEQHETEAKAETDGISAKELPVDDGNEDEADEYAENNNEVLRLVRYMKKRKAEGKELYIPEGRENEEPLLKLRDIYKIYKMGSEEVHANDGINLNVYRGDFLAIVGKSGSGKSTLMNIIGALDVPTSGDYFIEGADVSRMEEDALAEIRNKKIGFIFQQYNLLPKDNLRDNVALPLLYAGVEKEERNQRAMKTLERVGLADKWMQKPLQLSGGQQQRVSIARALAGDPELILADEPTGALDSKTSRQVLGFLKDINNDGNTVVMITHDNAIAMSAKRIVRISDGKIVYDGTAEEYAKLI